MKKILSAMSIGIFLSIGTSSHAVSPGSGSRGRNYNLRTIANTSGTFTGVKATYNNGASNLSAPVPTSTFVTTQSSFNTWMSLYDPATSVYPCYAEFDVIRRKVQPGTPVGPDGANITYDGWIYAVSVPKASPVGDIIQTQYFQRDANNNAVNNTFGGGLTVEISYQGNNLVSKRNGVTVLTQNNFKCYQPQQNGTLQLSNPVGGYTIYYGFEGNTSSSVWTNGASIGKMQNRSGSGAYITAPSMSYPTPQVSSWSNTYNPNDNLGTMILFR